MITKDAINNGYKLFDDGFWRKRVFHKPRVGSKKPFYTVWQKQYEKRCRRCDAPFLTITPKTSVYCSKTCVIKPHGAKHYGWEGGKINSRGYVKFYISKRKYRHEHVLIMEGQMGRKIRRNEHVHHINGIRNDNRIENLVVLTRNEHARIHRMKDAGRHHRNSKGMFVN